MAEMTGDTATADLTKALFAKALVLRAAMAYYPQYYASSGLLEYPTNPNWQVVYATGGWWGHLWKYNWTDPSQDFRQVRTLSQFELDLHDHSSRGWNSGGPNPYLIPFKDMVPGLARFLGDYTKTESDLYIDVVEQNYPDWYRAFTQSGLAREHSLLHPADPFQIFMAKSWIDKVPADTLRKYVDIPWLEAGDLFYLQKLAETIKAYRGWCWSIDDGQTCDDGTIVPLQGDLNNDNSVNIQDIILLINEIFAPSGYATADINNDSKIDILDVIFLINIIFS
ncbi:hypothetical protein COV24_01880 [candidate division WWE3 bacterium CG10_big_fil_rev_8_21_14_0_10_32_10]|uniref:Dockerin domain-containing protein n=1 Tax=candidate division WWE3 bacterium CG10_big_fil_rev_8_21_14_0_10_32_10 TaxID=1975090 RepID=A0A2H0RAJ6_UNCKA|nr:MAG: hypothetical protein COV24_01880 [candidate division WWE3 bacterium CG10_big_fil_rev_8_21_14_0_10_32_10]